MRSRTLQYIFIAAVLFLITVTAYVTLFSIIRNGNQEISRMRAQVEQEVNREQKLVGFQSLIRNTQRERDELDTYFIGQNGVVGFLELLEEFGSIADVEAEVSTVEVITERRTTMQNGQEVELPPSAVERLQVIVAVTGSFEGVYHYLSLIETMPFYTEIDTISIERARSENVEWEGLFGFSTRKLH